MRHNKLALFYHFTWATWDRLPLITAKIEESLHNEIHHEAQRMKSKVLALGGTEDHIHLLLEMPPTLTISELLKQVKGASSLFVNDTLQPETHFKWQGSFGAFTVSRWDVKKIKLYIQNQKQHHADNTLRPALEKMPFEE